MNCPEKKKAKREDEQKKEGKTDKTTQYKAERPFVAHGMHTHTHTRTNTHAHTRKGHRRPPRHSLRC